MSKSFFIDIKSPQIKLIFRALLFLTSAIIVIWFSLGLRILTFPKVNYQGRYDCAIVLGAAVDVAQPTPVFEARIKHGIDLYQQTIVENLIFTGGLGDGDRLSEGQVGANYAQKSGVSASNIFIEPQSKTTPQNLREAQKIMTQNNLNTAIIVSDPLHLQRALMVAKKLGIQAGSSATPYSRYRAWKTKLPFLWREIYFTIYFQLFGQ